MNNIPNSVPMQQQPNAPPLPPTRLPMRYPNRPRRRRHPRLNVGGVLGGNGYYPNIGGNGYYPNIGGNGYYPNIIGGNGYYPNTESNGYYPNTGTNGFYPNIGTNDFYSNMGNNAPYPNSPYPNIPGNAPYPNTRGYGYYLPFQNSNNYNYPMINRPRNYRRNVFYNRNYLPQQPYDDYYYNQPPGAVVLPRGRFYRQQGQRTGSSSRLRILSNRRRSRSDQRQSRSRQRQQQQRRRRRPRQLRLNDFMPPQLRDTSPMTTTPTNLPNQFNLGEMAATSATTTTAPLEALPQRERFPSQQCYTTIYS